MKISVPEMYPDRPSNRPAIILPYSSAGLSRYIAGLFLLFCFTGFVTAGDSLATDLQEYIKSLYPNHKHIVEAKCTPFIESLCTPAGINDENDREKICELFFLHSLFTTTDARDGVTGGILGIPYFWHWISPNPRYDIIFIPEKKRLNTVKPPEGYGKYKSYADIDRTPSIYLSNLFEEHQLFEHSVCGSFFTFGWCSEREMAFSLLLHILGYEAKIKQQDIHVWTEVLFAAGDNRNVVLLIDNTFNGFEIKPLEQSKKNWKKDFGNGAQVGWYNRKAHSPVEISKVKSIGVSDNVAKRIHEQIEHWVDGDNRKKISR